ncbi:hypothetical protein ACRALDRAFT_2101756 [Sodiomyces alcalophilus JCM 7366]|uniref:uncharacterized protein n=1 Tax=Sodiomyces alcalophilus JCM 7366 TaxID=591952 RepID=UPI0039B4E466
MRPPNILHDIREPGCRAVFFDRKLFAVENVFMKRTMRRHEWSDLDDEDKLPPSAAMPQRFRTDVAVQKYLRQKTDIPLPAFALVIEDDGAMHLIMEFVEGKPMDELPEADQKVVEMELQQHIKTLKSLRSDTPGVPGEPLMTAPQRVCDFGWKYHSAWRPRSDVRGDFVFCHNDLGRHNVLVNPNTLKITAIIDWEFGGFWPEWFERPFWKRQGGSYTLEGEEDDTECCREWLMANCEEVQQLHLPNVLDKLNSKLGTPKDLDGKSSSQKVESAAAYEEAEPAGQTEGELAI